jgi:hypothetical protein
MNPKRLVVETFGRKADVQISVSAAGIIGEV